jgi:large subunit ribosomal protein L24
MFKIKKGDTVQVITGADRGKKGKVLEIFGASGRALVEGIKLVKKHKRQTRQDQKGGIISTEAPIDLSNLMAICKNCNRPVRVGSDILKDGTKARVCKKCKESL